MPSPSSSPTPVELKSLANQAASLSAQAAASSGGTIISKAIPLKSPTSPKKKIILPSGLLVGLLLGLIVAFAWDKRDTTIKDAKNLGQPGAPVLLAVSAKDLGGELLAPPRSPAWLDFSELARSTTVALGEDRPLLLVAGVSAGQGTSIAAANLAVALARTHSAVILVCPSGQGTTELLGLPDSRILDTRAAAELATGELSVEEVALQPAGFPGLRVVVLAENLQDLSHAQARVLAEQLRISADFTVVEAPGESTGPDTLALAEYCSGALLTVEISVTRRPEIEGSVRRINRLGTTVLGLVAVPRLRLPARAGKSSGRQSSGRQSTRRQATGRQATGWQSIGRQFTGSIRLRKGPSGATPKSATQAPADDGEDHSAAPVVHADVADRHNGT